MARAAGRDGDQKEFIKRFDSLTGAYNRLNVWQDMVLMFATAISNTIPHPYWEQREHAYMESIGKYRPQQQQVFAELFAMLIRIMDDSVNRGDYGDFLGELFMGMELGNDLGGQFFTPYHICRLMARITGIDIAKGEIDRQGYTVINEPASGAGANLIAFAETLKENGIDYQQKCFFVAQEIDYTTALMCYIQLSLLGCAGYVHIGNTLSEPMTSHVLYGDGGERTWYTPMFFSEHWTHIRREVGFRVNA